MDEPATHSGRIFAKMCLEALKFKAKVLAHWLVLDTLGHATLEGNDTQCYPDFHDTLELRIF